MPILADCETDGLLGELTRIHCIVTYDTESGQLSIYDPNNSTIEAGIRALEEADDVVLHNGIGFDHPAILKLYPGFKVKRLHDTLVYTRLLFPSVKETDFNRVKLNKLPGKLIGSHSLEAWGYRLGEYKGDFGKTTDWKTWTPEMSAYCVQDVLVLKSLWDLIQKQELPHDAIEMEHQVAAILLRQERYGFLFDVSKAEALYVTLLQKRDELERQLKYNWVEPSDFKVPWSGYPEGIVVPTFVPKVNSKKTGYIKGIPCTKIEYIEFNPQSNLHVARLLHSKYGWTPSEFTPATNEPVINEEILNSLDYTEAKTLAELLLIDKRISQLATGTQAWLKCVGSDSRIHGYVNTMGAVTYRMTHSKPNMAQVPAGYSPYGKECRELFVAPKGKKLVGCDASGIEARCLAHYLAFYDGGEYGRTVVEGKKEDGTDVHTVNMKALGIDSRDDAKTWFYAFMYGAGAEKLGRILGETSEVKAKRIGNAAKLKFLDSLPAFKSLTTTVQHRAEFQKFLRGLDGRKLHVRSSHSALNTLLQSAGALIMKKALYIMDDKYQSLGYVPGKHYEFVANVHDEVQIECDADIADSIGTIAKESIRLAGIHFNFRCPLDGEYNIGANWSETH
jgi:DNA polymerase-1